MLTLFKTKLTNKINLANSVYSFTFQLVDPSETNFIAGQYMMLKVPKPDGSFIIRQLSITTSQDQKNRFGLLLKIVQGGVASDYLMKSPIGSEIVFQGPAGKFALKESLNNKIFLATGTGIAPILSMLYSLSHFDPDKSRGRNLAKRNVSLDSSAALLPRNDVGVQIYLFWGMQKLDDVCFFEELKQIEKENQNFHFYYCLSKETTLDVAKEEDKKYFVLGRVTKGIDELISNFKF